MHRLRFLCGVLMVAGCIPVGRAEVRLPALIGSNMVLQAGVPARIWGWADTGEVVAVSLDGERVETVADGSGRWSVALPPRPAGGPHVLRVVGQNALELPNILVGEVWLCSGQSQMEQGIRFVDPGWSNINACADQELRLFIVPRKGAFAPVDDVAGSWVVCSPKSILEGGWGGFSAIGYFFGRRLRAELGAPVGMIECAVGGTPIETWMSWDTLAAEPAADKLMEGWFVRWKRYQRDYADLYVDPVRPGRTADGYGDFGALTKEWKWLPAIHFNAMVAPISPYTIKGVLWYQGYANRFTTETYPTLFSQLVGSWRERWQDPELPFCFAEHASFDTTDKTRDRHLLARLREAQAQGAELPGVGMVPTYDLSNPQHLHYTNKKPVAERMAQWALRHHYGRGDLVCSGPRLLSSAVEGDRIRLRFDAASGGRMSFNEAKPGGFTIAGADRMFVPADVTLEDGGLEVRSDAVPQPVAVRYAWHDNPADANLRNEAGWPAAPFRTDDWPFAD